MSRLLIAVGAFAALLGCGDSAQQVGTPNDVALPGTPGAENQLVWFDNGLMVVGTCTAGHLPSREHCLRTASNVWDGVATRVAADLLSEVTAIEAAWNAERDRLRETHPEVLTKKREIFALEADIKNLGERVPIYERAIAKKRGEAEKIAPIVAEYDTQICAVKNRMTTDPTNLDLKRLLETLEREREAHLARKQLLLKQVLRLTAGLADIQVLLNERMQGVTLKKQELVELYQRITVTSPELDRLRVYKETMAAANGRVPRILTYIRDSAVAYRYDLLDKTDQTVIDRLVKAVGDRQLTIRLNGPDKALHVLHDGQWRSICDDGFDQLEADVICRSFGQKARGFKASLPTDGKYWLDDLRCAGEEDSIEECPANAWGQHNCGPTEGVAVVCD